MSASQIRRRLHDTMKLALQRKKRGQVFLEVFAGAGGISESIEYVGDFACIRLDILLDTAHDLTRQAAFQTIMGWMGAGLIRGIWVAPPCSTWSTAARILAGGKWTRYRTREFILGGPWLEPHHEVKVSIGNKLCSIACRMIDAALRAAIPIAIENPHGSLIWQHPRMLALCANSLARTAVTDFCQHGKPWRKRTRVVAWNVGPPPLALLRTCQATGKICSSTHRPHIILKGTNHGQVLTKMAEAYPATFSTAGGQWLARSAELRSQARLQHILN